MRKKKFSSSIQESDMYLEKEEKGDCPVIGFSLFFCFLPVLPARDGIPGVEYL